MGDFETDDYIFKEYITNESAITQSDIIETLQKLALNSDNIQMLTKLYTDILEDDNVVYIMTRISQNNIFMKHFPEFYEKNENGESVINCQQNSIYHKYGVFKHILYTIEYIAKDNLKYSAHDTMLLKWTMFLHDIGKPMVKTVNSDGSDSFYGHDEKSVEIAQNILDRFDFDNYDKKIILTLIKYHDKFLNEGELTYDNLSFLAKELDDKRDLFEMLIDVKIADNRAKSIDVYNKFMTIVGKYYDFANEYFSNESINKLFEEDKLKDVIDNEKKQAECIEKEIIGKENLKEEDSSRGVYKEGGSDEDLTEKIVDQIVKDITNAKRLKCYFQPIIDLKKQMLDGYELFYKIVTDFDFSYKQILRKANEYGKYDKLQQMLFVNSLEIFNYLKGKSDFVQYINIDIKSYEKYVNKARILDLIENKRVTIEFNNYESFIDSKIKDLSSEIFIKKGTVALDNFENSRKTIKDLEKIEPKCIKYKLNKTDEEELNYLMELSTFCTANSIKLVAFGIDNLEKLIIAKKCGIRFVQGDYFAKITDGFDITKEIIEQKIKQIDDDLIV